MKKYEELLNKMQFEICTTLMDNDFSRKGIGDLKPLPESEILRSNRRTYVNLKVIMMRLERALYGENNCEEDETEISNRDTCSSENTESGQGATHAPRVSNISC